MAKKMFVGGQFIVAPLGGPHRRSPMVELAGGGAIKRHNLAKVQRDQAILARRLAEIDRALSGESPKPPRKR